MKTSQKILRRTSKHCNGCDKEILRVDWDKHILDIIRSFRV